MLRVGIVAMVLSGCSFALVSGPPTNHRQLPTFDCTTSRIGPGLDTVWSVLQAANFITAVAKSDAEWDELYSGNAPIARSTALPLYAVLGAAGIAGMYYGFTRTSACRDAKNELNARIMQPGTYGAPMQPMQPAQPGVGTWPPPAPQPAPAPAPETPAAPGASAEPAAPASAPIAP